MSRKLKQKKVWVSVFKCSRCGKEQEFWHHGAENKSEAIKDIPSGSSGYVFSGTWNGWYVGKKNEELCPACFYGKK